MARWADRLNIKDVIATLSKSHVMEKDKVNPRRREVFMEEWRKRELKSICLMN